MSIKGKKVLVYGAGKSGIACMKLLLKEECRVVLFDNGKNASFESLNNILSTNDIDASAVEIFITENAADLDMSTVDIAVLSPGVPTDNEWVNALRDAGAEIWGEVELAYVLSKGTVVGITGTNGKTTTTALTGELLAAYFNDVRVVGNIGEPYTTVAGCSDDDTYSVVELSSFQLETIHTLHPHVAALTNLTPDHLDRHHTMDNYIDAKFNIFMNQDENDFAVLNFDDPEIVKRAGRIKSQILWFSSTQILEDGYYAKDGMIYRVCGGEAEEYIKTCELNIIGKHNVENAMTAIACADAMNIPKEVTVKALKKFKAVEHRIEFVRDFNDIVFYNDSKGTNTDAAIKAVEAMERPTVLIGGGYDKHADFTDWIKSFGDKIKALVLIGATAEQIKETALANGYENIIMASSLEEAVDLAVAQAKPGYAVLLSPACASWDMFKNYEIRGKMFKDFVMGLK